MKKRILWIDDDYYSIQFLFRPIQKAGFQIEYATSALDGYKKALNWQEYGLIVVDLILPISEEQSPIPEIVRSWKENGDKEHVGIGLTKWLLNTLNVTCPVVILSVVQDPISTYDLGDLQVAGYIHKGGLLPTKLREELLNILGVKNNKAETNAP